MSIKSCQRFKLKREEEKELAALDTKNIISSSTGRVTRQRTQATAAAPVTKSRKVIRAHDDDDEESNEENNQEETKKTNNYFAQIRDLVSSDIESDEDQQKRKPKSKQISAMSDEE